jgi:hypothetical protein
VAFGSDAKCDIFAAAVTYTIDRPVGVIAGAPYPITWPLLGETAGSPAR